MPRTITHLYDTYQQASQAVSSLEAAGLPNTDISIVGNEQHDGTSSDAACAGSGAGTGASIGTLVGGGAGLLAGIGSLAIPGIGPLVAAGWLVATLTGAGAGAAAGGLLGSLTGAGVSKEDADVYAEGVRRGGTLVAVRTKDLSASRIQDLLNSSGYVDVAARRATYRADGWERFDPAGAGYPSTSSVAGDTRGERMD